MKIETYKCGDKIGRLTIGNIAAVNGKPCYDCVCECGTRKAISIYSVGRRTFSCGCLAKQRMLENVTRHGLYGCKEYRTWTAMIQRCTNPRRKGYQHYGGRGIAVCASWKQSFVAFFNDIGRAPTPNHKLDRINNDGNYEPGNVRWVTQAEQTRNQRRNVLLTLHGKTQPVSVWAAELGISPYTLYYRVRRGWPTEKVLA